MTERENGYKSNHNPMTHFSGASDFEKFEAPNHEKYESRNPIAKALTNGFKSSLEDLISSIGEIADVHEVGCGEGYLSPIIVGHVETYRGSDLSPRLVEKAVLRAKQLKLACKFQVRNVYELEVGEDSAELIICCEVLEHLEYPELAIKAINGLNFNYAIFSVPREPIWRALNLLRGKYLRQLGNTPGHIQHWSKGGFTEILAKYFEIIEVKTPLPWTMVLVRKRGLSV